MSQGQAVPEEGQAGPCSPTRVSPARSLRATVVVWLQVTFGVRHLFLQAVLLLSPPRAGTSLQDGPRCPVGASSELSTSCPHVALAPQPHRRPSQSLRGPPAAPEWGGGGTKKHLCPPGLPWQRLGSYLEAAEDSVEVVESQDTVVDSQEAKEPGSANN